MTDEINENIAELQTRLAFQEKSLTEMDDIITDQRDMIDLLHKEIKILLERVQSLEESQSLQSDSLIDEKPPHY